MDKYAKLIDGKLSFSPNPLTVEGVVISNPSGQVLTGLGYKLFVDNPMPEYKEGFEIREVLTEKANTIERTWEYRELPIPEPSDYEKIKSVMDFNIDMGILIDPAE